jgi:hypothetical protein
MAALLKIRSREAVISAVKLDSGIRKTDPGIHGFREAAADIRFAPRVSCAMPYWQRFFVQTMFS